METATVGSLNKVIIIGNLGRDAELRYTPGGAAVATLSVATADVWTDKSSGQKQEKTEWHRVSIWGKAAESLSEYLTKGKQVCVEGRLQTRKWQDKDGNDKYSTEIRGDRVILLGGGSGGRSCGSRPRQVRLQLEYSKCRLFGLHRDADGRDGWTIVHVRPAC
jgi:single-strand DNA-binding protein